jgi:hypothetical protein
MGDHTTPLIHLTEGLRPSGTKIDIQEKDPKTGGYGKMQPMGIYETGTVDHVHELLHSMRKQYAGTGTRVHANVDYHKGDVEAARAKEVENISKNPEGSFAQMTSGATRQLAMNAEAARRVPTKAGTSFTA